MEFSQIFGFLKILSESIKLVLKNGKLIASITTLSLLLSSILLLLFSYCYQVINDFIMKSSRAGDGDGYGISSLLTIIYPQLPFLLVFSLMFTYFPIIGVSGIATVSASAMSYTDNKLSLQDLFSIVKTKCRSRFKNNIRGSRNPMHFLSIIALAVAIPLVMFNPNPIIITIASVVGVSFFVFQLYASVVRTLSAVISVVEDGCEAAEAQEKAGKLVQGQRLHGFMVNLVLNLLLVMISLSFWRIVGDQGSLNLTVYGFFFGNCILLANIFGCVVYTVYYFQCMEYHAQTRQLHGNFHYTVLPNQIP